MFLLLKHLPKPYLFQFCTSFLSLKFSNLFYIYILVRRTLKNGLTDEEKQVIATHVTTET